MTAGPAVQCGLCGQCRFKRIIRSDKGILYIQCERSTFDLSYPKYPRLPVTACEGFEQDKKKPGTE